MSEQNIIPSAPPLYPSLSVGDYRLKKISDCQKELENEISHYRRISKKYKRAKTIINAFATSTGVLTVVLSSASLATSLTLTGAIVGAPIAGIAALLGTASTAASRDLKQTLEAVWWRRRWPRGSGLRPPPLGTKLEI